MKRKDIATRADIALQVESFYAKVRKHELLGPIFNDVIKDWPSHLVKLTDFWETNLLFVRKYKGNPLKAHVQVETEHDHTIEQLHFGHWLQLWFETLDENFEGKNCELAKERARHMAHIMFLRIFNERERRNEA